MGIVYKSSLKEHILVETAYDGDRQIGSAQAISDGYDWSLMFGLNVADGYSEEQIGSELVRRLLERLSGQHVFVCTDTKHLSLYEELGFLRSKTSFTYTALEPEEETAWQEASGYYLPEGYRFEYEFYNEKPVIGATRTHTASESDVVYTDTLDGVDYNELNTVLSAAFGGHERDPKVSEDVFRRSQYVSLAYVNGRLAGMARAVSDKVSHALILNVAVDPSYQGLHIGWNIIVHLSEQLNGQNIFLNTHPGAVGFYNRKGFRRNKTALVHNPASMPDDISRKFHLPKGYRFPDEY